MVSVCIVSPVPIKLPAASNQSKSTPRGPEAVSVADCPLGLKALTQAVSSVTVGAIGV